MIFRTLKHPHRFSVFILFLVYVNVLYATIKQSYPSICQRLVCNNQAILTIKQSLTVYNMKLTNQVTPSKEELICKIHQRIS